MAYAGESGVTYTLPTNNSQIDTRQSWTLIVWVARADESDSPRSYPASPTLDGTGALWTNDATAFPLDPLDHTYNIELHCKNGSKLYKSRVQLLVSGAYGSTNE